MKKQSQSNNSYLTGKDMSAVDFLVYCEMYQVNKLYKKSVPTHLANLGTWYDRMEKEECFKEVNAQLDKVIDLHEIHDPVIELL